MKWTLFVGLLASAMLLWSCSDQGLTTTSPEIERVLLMARSSSDSAMYWRVSSMVSTTVEPSVEGFSM